MYGVVGTDCQHLRARCVVGLEHRIEQPAEEGDLVGSVLRGGLDYRVGGIIHLSHPRGQQFPSTPGGKDGRKRGGTHKSVNGTPILLVPSTSNLEIELRKLPVYLLDSLLHHCARNTLR